MNRVWLLLAATCLSAQMSFATNIDWSQIKYNIQDSVTFKKDQATIEADYLKRVEKDRIKEKYGREIMDRKPSGLMTVEEYEELSQPKDKAVIDYGTPKVNKPYDMQYVPQPTYKLAKYNEPAGSPNLTISRDLYKTRQLNLPGITAPDFSIMVYPAVYYYPVSESIETATRHPYNEQNGRTACRLIERDDYSLDSLYYYYYIKWYGNGRLSVCTD